MHLMFHDPSFSFELVRAIGYAVYGGADIGECLSTASRIQEGDCESWYQEWSRTAQRVKALADAALAAGSRVSAREAYLRASNYYRCAEFYLHTTPDDPRSLPTWEKSRSCFRQALVLSTLVCEAVEIPYEGTSLPGYFYLVDRSETPRPTLLIHGGYDSTGEELYFNSVVAALQRGYNCLTFEGPGQGRVVRLQGLPFRPDWQAVVTPVVDYVSTLPQVDPARLVLVGVSFGGYLAPRAAAYEHRLAACVAIDGLYSLAEVMQAFSKDLSAAPSPEVEAAICNAVVQVMMQNSTMVRWAVTQGMWTFAATSPYAFLQKTKPYTLEGIAQNITCPTLICDAEHDLFFQGQARKLYDALGCSKAFLFFSQEEGAGEHCHEGALLRLNQELFAWLDQTIG
jgi:pimeloyl-ACP methyl ester carboxylesterase